MSIRIKPVYPHLQQLTNNQESVEVSGTTLGECLNDLVRQFPEARKAIFANEGKLLDYVALYVNGKSTYFDKGPLATPIKDGDEILFALLIAGG